MHKMICLLLLSVSLLNSAQKEQVEKEGELDMVQADDQVGVPAVVSNKVDEQIEEGDVDSQDDQEISEPAEAMLLKEASAEDKQEKAGILPLNKATGKKEEALSMPSLDQDDQESDSLIDSEKAQSDKASFTPSITDDHEYEDENEDEDREHGDNKERVDDRQKGIDTVSLQEGQGNWLFKKIWWERAEIKFDKLRQVVESVMSFRMAFFDQRAELNKAIIDPFLLKIGAEQGSLRQAIEGHLALLEKERADAGSLNEEERSLVEIIKKEKNKLLEIKTLVEHVLKLNFEIDTSLGVLMQQVNRARSYENQAWDNFREIARVLNDKKAREIYYAIDMLYKNTKQVLRYIETDFKQHFSATMGAIDEEIGVVNLRIKELNAKGLELTKELGKVVQRQRQEKKADAGKQQNTDNISAKAPEQKKQDVVDQESNSWIYTIFVAPFVAVWNGITSMLSMVGSFFGIGNQE